MGESERNSKTSRSRNGNNDSSPSRDDEIDFILESSLQRHPLQPSGDGQPPKGRGLLESKTPEYQHAPLPRPELLVYVGVIVFLFFYIFWHLYQLSQEKVSKLQHMTVGWSFFGQRKKDESDDQWTAFVAGMTPPPVVLSYIAYIILGQIVVFAAPQFRKVFMLIFSMLWICLGFGSRVLGLLVLHSVLVYLVSHTRRQVFVWIVVLLAVASITINTLIELQDHYIGDIYGGIICIATCSLRLLCFGLEFCRNTKPERPERGYSLFDLLLFNFYLPVFPYGPLIGYDTFLAQINREVKLLSWKEIKSISKELFRCCFWAVMVETMLHFLYFGGMTMHQKTLLSLSARDLSFMGLFHLFFFQLSTLVIYSWSRVLASCDRITAPQPPVCILSMHFFRDMWRYFDRGLNAMLTKYIYIPLGGSKHGPLRQSLAALMCFLFVAFWHGGGQTYYTWALLNWIGVQFETAALTFSDRFGPLQKLQTKMSPPMQRRFYALCAVPNYLFLASSNLVFVIGPNKTRFFIHSMIFGDWPWNILSVFFAFYCSMQVVNEVERRVGKKVLMSKDYL